MARRFNVVEAAVEPYMVVSVSMADITFSEERISFNFRMTGDDMLILTDPMGRKVLVGLDNCDYIIREPTEGEFTHAVKAVVKNGAGTIAVVETVGEIKKMIYDGA